MAPPLYLDTSAVLRAILESGTSPEIEVRIRDASALVTSRLALVESSRALVRLRVLGAATESQIADAGRELDGIWNRCDIWELGREVCELARAMAPATNLRTLDALHLATFQVARRHLAGLELLTADEKLRAAAGA
ncbi:MAG: type II toxin-antitoxin system VapC family toxin [Candidatus Binatia bacterium]